MALPTKSASSKCRWAGCAKSRNPSALFLDQRDKDAAGSAVFAGMEGTRPVSAKSRPWWQRRRSGRARRAVVGWDASRLAMVLAVLETRCGVRIGANDIYLNVARAGWRSPNPPPILPSRPRWSRPWSPVRPCRMTPCISAKSRSRAAGIRPVAPWPAFASARHRTRLPRRRRTGLFSGRATLSRAASTSEFGELGASVGRIAADGRKQSAE